MKITDIDAYQVFDSRGHPTIEAVVTLESGVCGRGLVPSGASTGKFEAFELRDGDSRRFRGKSVFRAIEHIRTEIKSVLVGWNVLDQAGLDTRLIELDGTPNKSRLGANAILAVSMAAANAGAAAAGAPLCHYLGRGEGTLLPLPEIQIFGGGKHAEQRIDIQDFMIVATGATSLASAFEMTFNVFQSAGDLLRKRGLLAGLADEGGYWPLFRTHEEALETLIESIEAAGYPPGRDIGISLDIAATDLYRNGQYHLRSEGRNFEAAGFAELLAGWVEKYPIISIEDPMAENDWEGWSLIKNLLSDRVQLVGDDLFTTHRERIQRGTELKIAHAVLIKLNQIGTVTETLAAIRQTDEAGWLPVISARSGETEDAFISHLAVATNAGQLKVGAFCRGERTAKWNELVRIERNLGHRARFIGARIYEKLGLVSLKRDAKSVIRTDQTVG